MPEWRGDRAPDVTSSGAESRTEVGWVEASKDATTVIWKSLSRSGRGVRESCVTVASRVGYGNDARPWHLTPTCGTLVCAAGRLG